VNQLFITVLRAVHGLRHALIVPPDDLSTRPVSKPSQSNAGDRRAIIAWE
jgi:hypothetical protein